MPASATTTSKRPTHDLSTSPHGRGPLLQRDYWARIENCRVKPSEVGAILAERFCDFPPQDLCRFDIHDRGGARRIQVDDEVTVAIRFAGQARVRVVHLDDNSLTMATLPGHPEAGRITFGAYRHEPTGDVIFHIRSLARSSGWFHYAGFIGVGRAMQTNTWTRFIDAVAVDLGDGVAGCVHEETSKRDDDPPGRETRPTFVAKGD